ncbi:hypothetical protein CRUP_036460 [Coryphaenoides rupestris]|nr:hypothetical protein CRUP_036460 [Coryphaenoides rupestris]
METLTEVIPFAKEMLLIGRSGRAVVVKVYLLGSTLALLGVLGALVETILRTFSKEEKAEEEEGERQKQQQKGEPEYLFVETRGTRSVDNKKQQQHGSLMMSALRTTTAHRPHASST